MSFRLRKPQTSPAEYVIVPYPELRTQGRQRKTERSTDSDSATALCSFQDEGTTVTVLPEVSPGSTITTLSVPGVGVGVGVGSTICGSGV